MNLVSVAMVFQESKLADPSSPGRGPGDGTIVNLGSITSFIILPKIV